MARNYKYKHYCICGKGIRLKNGCNAGVCVKCQSNEKNSDKKCMCGAAKHKASVKCTKCQLTCDCGGRKSWKAEKCKSCSLVKHRDCVICGSVFELQSYARKRVTCSERCKSVAIKKSAERAALLGASANKDAAKLRQQLKLQKLKEQLRADKNVCVCCLCVMESSRHSTCTNCTKFISNLVRKKYRDSRIKCCVVCNDEFTNKISQSSKYCSKKCYRLSDEFAVISNNSRVKRRHKTASTEPVGRRLVFHRDKWTCQYCGQRVVQYAANGWLSSNEATLDHVIPLAHGGKHSVDNVVTACRDCNTRKGDKMFTDWL